MSGVDIVDRRALDPEIEIKCPSIPPLLFFPRTLLFLSPISFVDLLLQFSLSLSISLKLSSISRFISWRNIMLLITRVSNRIVASSFPCAGRKDLSMILVERVERRKTVLGGEGEEESGESRGREVERGRPCKGHHSNCPGLPFIPFVRPSGALPHPPSPSASPRLPHSPPPYRRL